jgi:hypothetical protein
MNLYSGYVIILVFWKDCSEIWKIVFGNMKISCGFNSFFDLNC